MYRQTMHSRPFILFSRCPGDPGDCRPKQFNSAAVMCRHRRRPWACLHWTWACPHWPAVTYLVSWTRRDPGMQGARPSPYSAYMAQPGKVQPYTAQPSKGQGAAMHDATLPDTAPASIAERSSASHSTGTAEPGTAERGTAAVQACTAQPCTAQPCTA